MSDRHYNPGNSPLQELAASTIDDIRSLTEASPTPPDIWVEQTLNRRTVQTIADWLDVSEADINQAGRHLGISWRMIAVPAGAEVWLQPPCGDDAPHPPASRLDW